MDDDKPFGRGWSALDHIRQYAEYDVAETQRLADHMKRYRDFEPRKTLHEYTLSQDGTTVVVFNTKVVIVQANGTVQEFARAQ